MNNSDSPAMPISVSSSLDEIICSSDFEYGEGLTKREHFAGLAMQGLCSDPNMSVLVLVKLAVVTADALLKELEKEDE